ncbi:hypothetical protein HC928_19230 [bacterium]|nr:hypothetical protein [bacterium]
MDKDSKKDSKIEGGRIRELEKENRLLARKLARSERERLNLEETNERKESLLRKVIPRVKRISNISRGRRQVIESLRKPKHNWFRM